MDSKEFINRLISQYFDESYYLATYPDIANQDEIGALEHYLLYGWKEGRNPSAAFDGWFYKERYMAGEDTVECPLVHYFREGASRGNYTSKHQMVTDNFDETYYLTAYPDIAKQKYITPLKHYLSYGWKEGRNPSATFNTKFYIERYPNDVSGDECPLIHYLMIGIDKEYATNPNELLLKYFDEAFYLNKYSDISKSKRMSPLTHYVNYGWKEGRDPSAIFNTKFYIERYMYALEEAYCPLVDYAYHGVDKGFHTNLYQLCEKYFDNKYYLSRYHDIENAKYIVPIEHYARNGWKEGRDPSAVFDTNYYVENNMDGDSKGVCPLLHYDIQLLDLGLNPPTTDLLARETVEKFKFGGVLWNALQEAIELDPMVALPVQHKPFVRTPLNYCKELVQTVGALRKEFASNQYDYLIFVNQVRMSGAAKIAGCFTSVLAKSVDPQKIMVVLTDGSTMEHPEWFCDGVRVLDLHEHIACIKMRDQKIQVLLDLVHGVAAKRLVNINSKLFWDTLEEYGRQLKQEFTIISYLFTWDEVRNAGSPELVHRVGYPIQWMRHTIDYQDFVLCDSAYLADSLKQRFFLDDKSCPRVETLLTPILNKIEVKTTQSEVHGHSRPKILWSSRLDKQKRVDILVTIIEQNPDKDFWIYGKEVLERCPYISVIEGLDNAFFKGAYNDVSEIAQEGFDAYIYTSQWDGIPTVLLDIAQLKIPIIASNVGGVGELIDKDTGWLINPYDDVSKYTEALSDVLGDAGAAIEKSDKLLKRVTSIFNENIYSDKLKELLLN